MAIFRFHDIRLYYSFWFCTLSVGDGGSSVEIRIFDSLMYWLCYGTIHLLDLIICKAINVKCHSNINRYIIHFSFHSILLMYNSCVY